MTTKTQHLQELVDSGVSRRRFARNVMLGGLGVAATAALGSDDLLAQSGVTDVDILNFALNLEYLEGEFQTVATPGTRGGAFLPDGVNGVIAAV